MTRPVPSFPDVRPAIAQATSPRPYIGITDFMLRSEVEAMMKVMRSCGSPYPLAVGVMMSRKTLLGLPTKWATAFPANDRIATIFVDDDDAMNVLHYADYDAASSDEDLRRAALLGGPLLDAIQFDMIWPNETDLLSLKWRNPHLGFVLQVGANAMAAEGDEPARVARRLERYREKGLVDYVLLDKSMGRGLGMDATVLLPFVRRIKDALPDVGIVVAGGLGPETTHLVEPILREFPDVSIDAQGQLRRSGDARDPIEWDRAAHYLLCANALYARCRR